MPVLAQLRLGLFGISPREARFARRGFDPAQPAIQARLEEIGVTFIEGYRAALLHRDPDALSAVLEQVAAERRGFAYEGAAMGVWLADFFTPWRRRFPAFVQGPGEPHAYMVHVGAGWALARLPVSLERALERMDPLLRWLAADGYGFHQGYFHWRRYIAEHKLAPCGGYAARAFDQGLGRCMWFVLGADPARVAKAMAAFPRHRQADLWSGIGLASAYAGGVDEATLAELRNAAGACLPELAQGAAFAAKARARAGNPAAHTELACRVLCEIPAEAAARITDQTVEGLPSDAALPAYEVWRQRIQAIFRR